jgi:chemotaxis protein CheD
MQNDISVGLGEIKVSSNPQDVLIAFGLGSCVGIGMYDPVAHIGGLLHAVLPIANSDDSSSGKYVDSGVHGLLKEMQKAGAIKSRIVVRIAGGANMLTSPGLLSTFDIGTRNIDSALKVLRDLGFIIKSKEIGGQIGRTVRLYISDGRMTIRIMGGKEKEF